MSFPPPSVGLVFAVVETLGGFLNFASEPIVEWISKSEIDNFYYVTIGVASTMVLINFISVPLAFEKGPKIIRKLDSERSKTVFEIRLKESEENNKENDENEKSEL